MRGVGGITLFLQNPTALLSEQVTSRKNTGAFLLGPLASENIGRGKWGGGVSSRGWVWWEQFSLQTVTPLPCLLLCLLDLGPSWGGFPGWLRTISLPCCPGTQEGGYPSTLLLIRVKYWLQVFFLKSQHFKVIPRIITASLICIPL